MADPILPQPLNDYIRSTVFGSPNSAIGDNIFGLNLSGSPAALPISKENRGFLFFTRPQLNMQLDNIRNYRKFAPYTSRDPNSMQTAIRCLLDPRLQAGYKLHSNKQQGSDSDYRGVEPLLCNLVDPFNAFIPLLTNNAISSSGWPDQIVPVHRSDPGLYNEVQSMPDGSVRIADNRTIDISFRNSKGNPILHMIYVWNMYMSLTFEGLLMPYLDMIAEREFDFNTRIYRITLDKDKRYVSMLMATGASFPSNLPIGMFGDFNIEKPFNEQVKEFTVKFESDGVDFMDDIIAWEFNEAVKIHNTYMKDEHRDSYMQKLIPVEFDLFIHRYYPRINLDTGEFERWVFRNQYIDRMKRLKTMFPSLPNKLKVE